MKKLLIFLILLLPLQADAAAIREIPLEIRTQNSSEILSLPHENAAAGISMAIRDLGNDGQVEIITANGLGMEPKISVLRQDGSEIGSFLAYGPEVKMGLNVIACDLTGDGFSEIIVAPQRGGGPHIRFFDRFGSPMDGGGFFAYAGTFLGGVNLACGNIDDDAKEELITLPGTDGGPHIRIWKYQEGSIKLTEEFFAFDHANREGIIGVVHEKDLYVATQKTTEPRIKLFSFASPPQLLSEEQLSINANGISALFIHNSELHASTASHNAIYNLTTKFAEDIPSPFGSIQAASADLNNDGIDELIVAPTRPSYNGTLEGKEIIIDLSEQRLYAYHNGILENTFLISTARAGYTTPVGNHVITAKKPLVHYRWSYGPGNPNNYDLGLVPYNLQFFPHIYIHYAPWHNNFGNPMSHGCVNVNLENIKWIYNWSDEGIPVTVRT